MPADNTSSKKLIPRMRNLFAYRFAWKLLLVVIFAIIVVEIGIIVPSYNNQRDRLFSSLDELARMTAKLVLAPAVVPNDTDLSNQLDRIVNSDNRIVGALALGADGRGRSAAGELINQVPESFLNSRSLLLEAEDRYVLFLPQQSENLPVSLIVSMETSHIDEQLTAYVLRIAGLVVIIAGFAGLVVFLYITRSLLTTLAEIRVSLQKAKENPTIADNFTILHNREDELGETTDLLNTALIEIAENHRSSARHQEQRLRDFANSGSDWFWEMDAKLRFSYFSEKFESVSGVNPRELLGKTRKEAPIPGIDPEAWQKHLADLSNRRAFREFVHPRTRDDGSQVWLSISGIPCYDQQENFIGFRGVGSDITESIKTQIELKQAKESAEQASRAKSNFLATMSHEIRTPMNGIIGMTDLMQASNLDVEQKTYVSTIKSSGKALMTILNDILDYSKLEAQRISLESIPFNLENIIKGVIQIFEPSAAQKGLNLACEVNPEIDSQLVGDPGRIRQVLLNLVGNAIKFTETGSVRITARLLDSSQDTQSLRVEVNDTGIGIGADKVDKLFDSFTQADESTTRKYGGTGLGLAISQKIIETMKGDIGVTSNPGKGSLFWFELNLSVSDDTTLTQTNFETEDFPDSQVARSSTGDKLKALVVDDVPVNIMVAKNMLEKMGFQISEAKNGVEAVSHMQHEHYDVVLMDLQMPVMDGFEATQQIRSLKNGATVPIIALTAATQDEDRKRAVDVGMNAFLNKPFVASQLQDCLTQYFSFKD